MLTDFIADKSRDKEEQWVVMGNSIGGLLALMLTESLQDAGKVSERERGIYDTVLHIVAGPEAERGPYRAPENGRERGGNAPRIVLKPGRRCCLVRIQRVLTLHPDHDYATSSTAVVL